MILNFLLVMKGIKKIRWDIFLNDKMGLNNQNFQSRHIKSFCASLNDFKNICLCWKWGDAGGVPLDPRLSCKNDWSSVYLSAVSNRGNSVVQMPQML